jgi:hypothetical protein
MTNMKTDRILGILWLAFCSYSSFNELRALLSLRPSATGLWSAWYFLAIFFSIYLVGIVASIFLFRGESWARWFIGLIATFVALGNIVVIVTLRFFPVRAELSCIFALVSLVFLFLAKQEPVD